MRNLSRYLLGSQPLAALQAAGVNDATTLWAFTDQIFPDSRSASGVPDPALPVPRIDQFPLVFRPCWLEDAMNRAGAPNVLLLPLASRDEGYPGITSKHGLKTVVESAFLCLWNQCAVARDIPSTDSLLAPGGSTALQRPSATARKLWMAAHSAGNIQMSDAISRNPVEVDRVISFSPVKATDKLEPLIRTLAVATPVRAQVKNDDLEVFVISAPDLTHDYRITKNPPTVRGASMKPEHAQKLIATGARVTFLPPFNDQFAHYTLAPASSMRPFLHHLLGQWSDNAIETSAASPNAWEFLFFHEYPVFGGDLDSSTTPATFRPFFLQALGAPSPLTAPPKQYPP
jgi:hypothetical protein